MSIITQLSQLDLTKTYSYADYLTWQLDETLELIKGKIMLMSPAPNVQHQRVSRNMLRFIDNYLTGKKCEVFYAPFDVRLTIGKNPYYLIKKSTPLYNQISVSFAHQTF